MSIYVAIHVRRVYTGVMSDAKQIAKAIRSYRMRYGMSLEQLAERSRMQYKQLWLLENEKVKKPTAKSVFNLLRAGVLRDVEHCADCDCGN